MCNWINDAHHFLLENFDTIYNAPSQIYHSALPFCPSSSWICKYYGVEVLNEVKIVRGLSTEWGTCTRTVPLDHEPLDISYWNNIVAVALESGDIIILNAVTGSQTGIFSGHSGWVRSVTFSTDGALLASGSYDKTIKLWDMQTGGIVRTFSGHSDRVYSVCISADSAMIASGSDDKTICLWNIQTGECCYIISQPEEVHHVNFLPMSSQHLISISFKHVQQWNIYGHQIGPEHTGSHIAFSLDGTQFALSNVSVVTVYNTEFRGIIAKFHVDSGVAHHCCFSPDGRLIAANVGSTIHVWDITNSDHCLIDTFFGHSDQISAIAFSSPSSLISASWDKSVKFWQIGTSLADQIEADSTSVTYHLAHAKSVTLQAVEGIIITSDSDGVVRIWDIFTGYCLRSCQTQLQDSYQRDARLISNRLIIVWYEGGKICIWDAEKQELLSEVVGFQSYIHDIKISGDGSKVLSLDKYFIKVWSIWTGQNLGRVTLGGSIYKSSLNVEGPRVWVYYLQQEWEGWDFEIPGSPLELGRNPPSKLHPNGFVLWDIGLSRIQDTTSRKVLFQLGAGVGIPVDVGWNDQYIIACFGSGKVLVLNVSHILLQ